LKRSPVRVSILAVMVILLLSGPLTTHPVSAAEPARPRDQLVNWYQGPVRYLLRGVEVRLFRSLETDAQRLAFIIQFWGRRDPGPGTLENEAREEFWTRVARANSLFTRTTVPGWRTDMGRVYITLGPPTDREFDPFPKEDGGLTMPITDLFGKTTPVTFGGNGPGQVSRGVERWSYRGLNAPTLPTEFMIAFRKQSNGDYELSADARDIDRFRDSMSSNIPALDQLMGVEELEAVLVAQSDARSRRLMDGPNDTGDSRAIDPNVASNSDPAMISRAQMIPPIGISDSFNQMALALDMGRVGSVPRFEELMGELITSADFFGVLPFQVETHFYRTTMESALATVTVGIPREALGVDELDVQSLEMALRVQGIDQPGYRQIISAPGAFVLAAEAESEPGQMVFQTVAQVPPGRYRFSVGLRVPQQDMIASGETIVQAPAFHRRALSLSTLCLAQSLQPAGDLDQITEQNAVVPFRIGRYHLVPRLIRRLGQDDQLSIYYQVYGAGLQDEEPKLRATYTLSQLDAEGELSAGDPIILNDLHQAVQGFSLPVKGWPAGSYRLRVTVEDMISGAAVNGETVFSVAPQQES
jgi:GWxTD domain-containing protein